MRRRGRASAGHSCWLGVPQLLRAGKGGSRRKQSGPGLGSEPLSRACCIRQGREDWGEPVPSQMPPRKAEDPEAAATSLRLREGDLSAHPARHEFTERSAEPAATPGSGGRVTVASGGSGGEGQKNGDTEARRRLLRDSGTKGRPDRQVPAGAGDEDGQGTSAAGAGTRLQRTGNRWDTAEPQGSCPRSGG